MKFAELERLQKFETHILETTGPDDERLELIYDRLDEIDPSTFEARASELLHSLGFTQAMIHRATEDMSGGWRDESRAREGSVCAADSFAFG